MDDKIAQFVSITHADEQKAMFYLEATGGDVDEAISQFFASGDTGAYWGRFLIP